MNKSTRRAWQTGLAIGALILSVMPALSQVRDRGVNQPGAAGNAVRDPGVNQPGAAGNVGAPGKDPEVNQPDAAGNKGAKKAAGKDPGLTSLSLPATSAHRPGIRASISPVRQATGAARGAEPNTKFR